MKVAIMLMVLLDIETAVASWQLIPIAPYILVGSIITVSILVANSRLDKRTYPVYIYGLALASVWQTSMIGSYIVGVDIHTEIATVKDVIANGWNPSLADNNAGSLVLGVISPALSQLIDPVWQFKVIYPAMFASVPVVLFLAYKDMFNPVRAFFASIFIMVMPMFTMETPSMVKGLVAQSFLALSILFLVRPFRLWVRITGISVCLALTVVNHYTVGFVAMGIMVGIFALKSIISLLSRRTVGVPWGVTGVGFAVVMIVLLGYYSIVGSGGMLVTVRNVVSNVVIAAGDTFDNTEAKELVQETSTITSTTSIENQVTTTKSVVSVVGTTIDAATTSTVPNSTTITTSKELMQGLLNRTGGTGNGLYLLSQEPIVRTAMGLDFFEVSIGGKLFRILQLLTEVAIMLGVALIVFRRRQYKLTFEYVAGVLSCMGLILGCLFIPFLSTSVSATRFYELSLLFLAPMFVIGMERIGKIGHA